MDELLWHACTNPNTPILGVTGGDLKPKMSPSRTQTTSLLWGLWTMNSNLNHASPFNIHIMRHWNSQGALQLWFDVSDTTLSWCWNVGTKAQFLPTHDWKASLWRPLQTIKSNLNHASPFNIHIMRHWNSQGAAVMVWGLQDTQSWCWNVQIKCQMFPWSWLKSQPVETIADNAFQSQPCLTI